MTRLASVVRTMHRSFIRIHILSLAVRHGEVYGAQIAEQLAAYGYAVSPGTLYPALHDLLHNGLLHTRRAVVGGRSRKYYAITPKGCEFLLHMKSLVRELSNLLLKTRLPSEEG